MTTESDYIKTVFGLKLKQQRQKKNWSLQDLANRTGVSKSYLNEIENGKKYPKHDKILQLSEILECKFDDLVSTKLDKSLSPISEILKSDFFKEIPLELFGINRNMLINIISESPKKVTAFINTIIEISQNYNLGKERFYFAVVRSFQELYDNYFPDIEAKAKECFSGNNLSKKPNSYELEKILINEFGYEISTVDFETYGATGKLRSLYIPENRSLLLNTLLDEDQKTFILAKEIGYNILNLSPRPNTYSWLDFISFEELMNNFYSSYFAGSLLIRREDLSQKTGEFFQNPEWQPKIFERLIREFTNSPETFYYRLTNILPQDFGTKDLFYLCFTKKKKSDKVQILKELHLNQQQAPHANATNEHYCRRWIAIKNLINLKGNEQVTEAQISHYKDSGLSYLVISTSEKNPFSDGTNRSYCIGILLNANSLKKINFAKSDSVRTINVGVTCESCSIIECEVRMAPPVRLEKEQFNEDMKMAIGKIRKEFI
ncbi:helix-turn-helix domain-containing protein [Chryseobacterium taklimakanense]|uniref:helix-turn-helix domain-containing protein n=1 Tax=Chryseobacterium taklimakanense TaxID=536441 RepID=UPI001EF47B4A|nr:XRE family transcriptional regulator [Chryseobacterium taklimakanense]MCG7281117.1 helix-turn-helix domain-containing protein [Chryseobacterium taklimakanense]